MESEGRHKSIFDYTGKGDVECITFFKKHHVPLKPVWDSILSPLLQVVVLQNTFERYQVINEYKIPVLGSKFQW